MILLIYQRTLPEHTTSLHSVPCAYFRVSLRDCAILSSRWVDFADFGLVGFRFFVQLVKMMRAFVIETTASLRCVRVFVKLRSVAYAPISGLPHMAIMCHHERGSKDIFRPHTEANNELDTRVCTKTQLELLHYSKLFVCLKKIPLLTSGCYLHTFM